MMDGVAPVRLALLASCAVLSVCFGYEMAAPIGAFEAPVAQPFRPASIAFSDSASVPSSPAFDDIQNRLLFNPARKPVHSHSDASAAGGPAPFPTDIALIGVIIEGNTRLAMIKSGTQFAKSLTVGSEIEGWTLTEIDPDKVVLQLGDDRKEILLASNRPPQPTNAALTPSNGTPAPDAQTTPADTPSSSTKPNSDDDSDPHQ